MHTQNSSSQRQYRQLLNPANTPSGFVLRSNWQCFPATPRWLAVRRLKQPPAPPLLPTNSPMCCTQVTDSELSQDFFQNRTRMWYDLLGDVAEAHVGRIYSGF